MKDNTFLVYDFVVHVSESTVWYGLYGSCKRWYHLVRDCISIRAMIYDGIIGDGTCLIYAATKRNGLVQRNSTGTRLFGL